MFLENKVAIVTGAAQGIGRGIAEMFSAQGAVVVLCDINGQGAKNAAAEITEQTGVATEAFQVDVTKKSDVQQVVAAVVERFGRIDLLVNAAGIVKLALAVDMDEETWDSVMDVNVKGPFLFSQAVAKVMIEGGGGKIINIASDSGKRPELREAAYCSSKSALIGLTRVLALELGPYNINCNAICPGATDTPLLRQHYLTSEEKRREFIEATALKRIATPEDIAKVALFFASHLSDHVTGEIMLVTAGDLMGE